MSEQTRAIKQALNELGEPSDDYPAPVANAVQILRAALRSTPEAEGRRGLIERLEGWRDEVAWSDFFSESNVNALVRDLNDAIDSLRSAPEESSDDLRCTRCCQPLPADLPNREQYADFDVLCGPSCTTRVDPEGTTMGSRDHTCPTCGSPVEVVSSDEGTGYYREPERPQDHRVKIEFMGEEGMKMTLVCPESGCEPPPPEQCVLVPWADEAGFDILVGSIELPVEATWESPEDGPTLHLKSSDRAAG